MPQTIPAPIGNEAFSPGALNDAASPKSDCGPGPDVWKDMYIDPATALLNLWQSSTPVVPPMSASSPSTTQTSTLKSPCESFIPSTRESTPPSIRSSKGKGIRQARHEHTRASRSPTGKVRKQESAEQAKLSRMILRSHRRKPAFWELDASGQPRPVELMSIKSLPMG